MIAAPVQSDVDGIPKRSHSSVLRRRPTVRLSPSWLAVLLDSQIPGELEPSEQLIGGRLRQADVGRAHPPPTARDGEEHFRGLVECPFTVGVPSLRSMYNRAP